MIFENYKVAITGATSGIGLAAAEMFLREGAEVIGIGRNFEKTSHLGDKFIPFKCDVRNEQEIEKACRFIAETFGGELDTFVNNAGSGESSTIYDVTAEQFVSSFSLLLMAPMIFGKLLYPLLKKGTKNNSSIINTASSASRACSVEKPLYNLAKNALVLYTKQQAKGFIGVRCNSISPGFIQTPIFEREGVNMPKETVTAMYDAVALVTCGRTAEPEETADLIGFLASEDAAYINGTDVLTDGGLMTVYS